MNVFFFLEAHLRSYFSLLRAPFFLRMRPLKDQQWFFWYVFKQRCTKNAAKPANPRSLIYSQKIYIPLDPKTMKNDGFKPPKYGL